MRKTTKAAAIGLLLALASTPAALSQPMAVVQNDPAPPLFGTDLAGTKVRVDWSAQRLTLVNFWATWCPPCRDEMPVLQELHARYAEQGLRIVGVCRDRTPAAEIVAWLESLGIEYTILTERGRFGQSWGGTDVLPTTFLVGDDGIVLRRYVGGAPEARDALVRDVGAFFEGRPLGAPYVPRLAGDQAPAAGSSD